MASDSQSNAGPLGILVRPRQSLQSLPFNYRWEVTRRHPYYQTFWMSAHKQYSGEAIDEMQAALSRAAVMVLLAIGVSGDPPPPGSDESALGFGQLASAWDDGAVAPVTYRVMFGALLADLPLDTHRNLGEMLLASSAATDQTPEARYDLMMRLRLQHDPALDRIPNRPMIGVNIFAPQRAIEAAVTELVRGWKAEAGIEETRRRNEMLDDYLAAWDMREGWVTDHYDVEKEVSFQEIASRTNVPVRTAANRYYSAFELVTGHAYSFRNWFLVFAVEKIRSRFGSHALRRRHMTTDRNATPVTTIPVSILQPESNHGSGILELASATDYLSQAADAWDVAGLIENGWSDADILSEMQFEDEKAGRELIQYLRTRHAPPPN